MRVHAESTVSTAMLLLLLLLIVVSSQGNVAQGGISLLQLQPFGAAAAAAAAVAACFGGRIRVVPVHPSMHKWKMCVKMCQDVVRVIVMSHRG